MPVMAAGVSWHQDATTDPWLRALFLLGAGLVYGVAVLVAGAGLATLALVLLTGSTAVRLLVVLLVLVGGPLSLVYLLPMVRDPDQRPTFYPESMRMAPRLSLPRRAGLGVLAAALLATAWWLDPRLAAVLVAGGVLAGLAYALAASRGSIDPERATLDTGAREFDLGGVTGYRTRRLGPVALVSLSAPARPGRFGSVPSRVVVPADRLADVCAALDAVIAGEAAPGREPNRAVRLAAGALALLFVAVGAAAVALVGRAVGWYAAAVCWLFGAILLVVAREG
jgi:hypothetical protein